MGKDDKQNEKIEASRLTAASFERLQLNGPTEMTRRYPFGENQHGTWLPIQVPNRNNSVIGILSDYCTVTLTVVV